jgi:hypothetical protein
MSSYITVCFSRFPQIPNRLPEIDLLAVTMLRTAPDILEGIDIRVEVELLTAKGGFHCIRTLYIAVRVVSGVIHRIH